MTMQPQSDAASAVKLRVLWLSGFSPVGVTSGLAMYTRGLSEALDAAGIDVVGLGISQGQVGQTHAASSQDLSKGSHVPWTQVVSEPRGRVRSLFGALPYIASRLATSEHKRALVASLDRPVDVVVIDHLMAAWCLDHLRRWQSETGGVIVHVSHNHETKVRSTWAKNTSFFSVQGASLRFDARRIARLESRVMAAADAVAMITLADRKSLAHQVDFSRSFVLSPGRDEPAQSVSDSFERRPRRVCLLGSFDWQAKRDNIEEVAEAFDDVFHRADIELVVIGSGDDAFLDRQRNRWRAVRFLGFVDDMSSELDECRFGLVAEPVGGGFKLKALDYIYAGVPMAVLDGSMEGIDLEPGAEMIMAASLEELAVSIVTTIDETQVLSEMAQRAQTKVHGGFEWSDRGRRLAKELERLCGSSASPPTGSSFCAEGDSA